MSCRKKKKSTDTKNTKVHRHPKPTIPSQVISSPKEQAGTFVGWTFELSLIYTIHRCVSVTHQTDRSALSQVSSRTCLCTLMSWTYTHRLLKPLVNIIINYNKYQYDSSQTILDNHPNTISAANELQLPTCTGGRLRK